MLRFITLSLSLLSAFLCLGTPDSLLRELDGMISQRAVYEQTKRTEIEEHKANYKNSMTPADRYNTLRGLYGAYRSYRIDSAMIVADARLKVAREIGEANKIASATLNLAEAYVKSGMSDKAIEILDTLDTTSLEKYHKKYRFGIYRTAYSAKVSEALLPADRIAALEKLQYYIAEGAKEAAPGSLGAYTLQAEKLRDAGMNDEAVALMEEAAGKYDFSNDAAMQYTLGEMYLSAGKRSKAIESLARSAMSDIANNVKEYRALILLASLLFEDGDLTRAFDYINCAFDDAEFSHSQLRTAEVMRSMPLIDASFHEAERQINRRTGWLLTLACMLVILLLVSLTVVIIEFRANKRMLATIADINGKLEQKNEALVKEDALKSGHINMLMQAYASHISRLRDFRKTVYRLLKTSQMDSALDFVKSDKAEALDIADFHAMFDQAFLSMYPDFIRELEQYLNLPQKMKVPGRLSPELRVAAMLRLGMSSTEEIAGLMHYSAQSVYNLRSSLKAMLKVPWEDFEAYLKKP